MESESESRSVLFDSFQPHGLYIYSPWNSPGQNTGVGSLSLLHGIFPTQGSKPGLLHSGWILYQLSHKGSPSVVKPLTKNHSMSVWLQNSLPKLLRRPPPTAPYFTEKKRKKQRCELFLLHLEIFFSSSEKQAFLLLCAPRLYDSTVCPSLEPFSPPSSVCITNFLWGIFYQQFLRSSCSHNYFFLFIARTQS